MPAPAKKPVTTPIPVQLSEADFTQFILPHLTMPKRGPRCKLGYYRVFNLILWVLYTGMQWKCLPVPKDGDGHAEIHYATIYKVFAKWTDDGSIATAFVAWSCTAKRRIILKPLKPIRSLHHITG